MRAQWAVLFLIPYYLVSLGYLAAFLLAALKVIGFAGRRVITVDASLYPWPLNCPLIVPEREGITPLPGPMPFGYRFLLPVEEWLYTYGFVLPILPAAIIIAPLLLHKSTDLLHRELRLQGLSKGGMSTRTGKGIMLALMVPPQSVVTYLSYDLLRTFFLTGIYSLEIAFILPSFLVASFSSFVGTVLLLAGRRIRLSAALVASPWVVAGIALYSELMRYSLTCSST